MYLPRVMPALDTRLLVCIITLISDENSKCILILPSYLPHWICILVLIVMLHNLEEKEFSKKAKAFVYLLELLLQAQRLLVPAPLARVPDEFWVEDEVDCGLIGCDELCFVVEFVQRVNGSVKEAKGFLVIALLSTTTTYTGD